MFKQIYRPSASLILAARQQVVNNGYDYKLLLTMRTEPTAYAPNHCVFPGGIFNAQADESLEWLNYFRAFGIKDAQLQELVLSNNRPAPLMTSGHLLSRDISLRLTAIRETFEEVGLLLCRTRDSITNSLKQGQTVHVFCDEFARANWQEAVHKDGQQFLRLCQALNVVPDLWALSEWSIWRSPTTASKKYDTVYYFAALETELVELLLEPNEVQMVMWLTPVECLHKFSAATIWLPFILFYEISRLTNACNWSKLCSFAVKRSTLGSTLLMASFYRCDEGLVATLPGDDLYPDDPERHLETLLVSGGMQELQQCYKKQHHILISDMFEYAMNMNTMPLDGHLSPLIPATATVSKL